MKDIKINGISVIEGKDYILEGSNMAILNKNLLPVQSIEYPNEFVSHTSTEEDIRDDFYKRFEGYILQNPDESYISFDSIVNYILKARQEAIAQERERANNKLRELNATLREQCIDTQLITIEQWNEEIAPKLSELSMAIEGVNVTAKTYRLPLNYFE